MPAKMDQSRHATQVCPAALTAADQYLVRPVLISELRRITLPWFLVAVSITEVGSWKAERVTDEFNCNLLVVQEVGSFEDDAE